MNRFQASRFRNTTATIAQRQDWLSELHVDAGLSSGRHIQASVCLLAFSSGASGALGVLPLSQWGPVNGGVPTLHCHSDIITDFGFSPFDDLLLGTCSADHTVRLWRLPEGGVDNAASPPSLVLPAAQSSVELLRFHPAADGVLGSASGDAVTVWDVLQKAPLAVLADHSGQVQDFSWQQSGVLLTSTCKDKKLRVFDPRLQLSAVQAVKGHDNDKDSRVLWLGNQNLIVSTGFSQVREREVKLWDVRRLTGSVCTETLNSSSGILLPLYDADSGLLFLAGKGDNVVYCMEVSESQPTLSQVCQCVTDAVTRGVALLPKRALDVMGCEVARLLQLTSSTIVPVRYTVPRKNTFQFHADLFVDTAGDVAAMLGSDWWTGQNRAVEKVSLDPTKRQEGRNASAILKPAQQPKCSVTPSTPHADKDDAKKPLAEKSSGSVTETCVPAAARSRYFSETSRVVASCDGRVLMAACFSNAGVTSKFRHMRGVVLHRDTHIGNLRNVSLTTPGECDGMAANHRFIAVPLATSGGQLAVLPLSQTGKLQDAAIPTVQNGTAIADFCWDPFNPCRLAVAGEDGRIRLWIVPEAGLSSTLTEPHVVLSGHTEKIYSLKFHPLAADVLASSSYDMSVRIWDLKSKRQILQLEGHSEQIFSLAWSPDGQRLATVSKDGKVRIFNPRQSTKPMQEGPGPAGSRGARVVWALQGTRLLVSGFDSGSVRQVSLHDAGALAAGPVSKVSADVSPSTLIPSYDPDCHLVFLTGKGDTRVSVYELSAEPPYFLECSGYSSSEPHKGMAFLRKTECNVRDVEFARALRLGNSTIEPLAFSVPRVKREYFQDDLFPDTLVWWEAALTADAWFAGTDGKLKKRSLCPGDMPPLSSVPREETTRKYAGGNSYAEEKSDQQKKEELLNAMVSKLSSRDDPLPQDEMEGVDDDEWDD
ncbi:unnamed protein product [Lampetra planeri]